MVDVKKTYKYIEVSMNDCVDNLKEIENKRKVNKDELLTKLFCEVYIQRAENGHYA